MELADLIERYHALKETLRELEVERAELEKPYVQALQAIENECLARLQAQGLQNAKTPHGTAYIATQTRVSVKEKGSFLQFMLRKALESIDAADKEQTPYTIADEIMESGMLNMLDIRALKEPVKEFVKEHNANPPGVEVSHWVECNIRKS